MRNTISRSRISTILVTGGAGYIGSHTVLVLLKEGFNIVVLDNLCNSSIEPIKRVERLTGCSITFVEGDVRDSVLLNKLFNDFHIDAVVHFAGLKAINESIKQPLRYYDNNVVGSQVLLQAMYQSGVYNLVFSSSATVYGEPEIIPIPETCPLGKPSNPYGRSKQIVEEILRDIAKSEPRWRIAVLRYFNPVGSHQSGEIGDDPTGIPSNLMPYIAQVAVGRISELSVFGSDYPTPDGTCIRDYIHVMDLAEGHICALRAVQNRPGVSVWNLGTGKGMSVLEVVRAFENVIGRRIPYRIAPRRSGDIPVCYANPYKAVMELHWKAKRNLDEIMRDVWRWQSMNPNGYEYSQTYLKKQIEPYK